MQQIAQTLWGGTEIRFLVKYREIAIQNIIVESQFFGRDILYSKAYISYVSIYNTLCNSMGHNLIERSLLSILGVPYREVVAIYPRCPL